MTPPRVGRPRPNRFRLLLALGLALVCLHSPKRSLTPFLTLWAQAGEDNGGSTSRRPSLLVLRVEGTADRQEIDRSLEHLARWREDTESGVVVVDVSSLDGDIDACRDLSSRLLDLPVAYRSVGYVRAGERVQGIPLLILLACGEVALGRGAEVGTPGPVARSYDAEVQRKLRRQIGEMARRRAFGSLIASALLVPSRDAILRVKRRTPRAGEGQYAYLTVSDWDSMDPADRNRLYDKAARGRVIDADSTLVIDGEKASEYGLVAHYNLPAEDSTYTSLRGHEPLEIVVATEDMVLGDRAPRAPPSPEVQSVVDVLNSVPVRFLLLLIGSICLLLELKMPGTLIPGIAGLVCFLVFFIAATFPVAGAQEATGTWLEPVLFFCGIGLLLLEFFLLPGVAIFALAGGTLCLVSLILAMVGGDNQSHQVRDALAVVSASLGIGALAFFWLLSRLPKSSWWSRGGLVTRSAVSGVSNENEIELIGQTGITETLLRPAGKVELSGGRVIDVVSEGTYIEQGEQVRIVSVLGARVVVEPFDGRVVHPEGSNPSEASDPLSPDDPGRSEADSRQGELER